MTTNRRADDERISKIENTVVEIKTKLNNGLTERTLKNTEHLEQLFDKHTELDKKLDKHIVEYKAYQSQHINDMIEVKESLSSIVKIQGNWLKFSLIMGASVIGIMFTVLIWTIAHSETIAKIMNHLTHLE